MKNFLFTFLIFFLISCGEEVLPVKNPTPTADPVTTPVVEQSTQCPTGSSYENCECFKATNIERQKNNLPVLAYCDVCFRMAQEQAEDMILYNYYSHDRPAVPGREAELFAQRANRFQLGNCGENIVRNSGSGAVAQWMASSGHRANILDPSNRSFACGFKGGMSVQVFTTF